MDEDGTPSNIRSLTLLGVSALLMAVSAPLVLPLVLPPILANLNVGKGVDVQETALIVAFMAGLTGATLLGVAIRNWAWPPKQERLAYDESATGMAQEPHCTWEAQGIEFDLAPTYTGRHFTVEIRFFNRFRGDAQRKRKEGPPFSGDNGDDILFGGEATALMACRWMAGPGSGVIAAGNFQARHSFSLAFISVHSRFLLQTAYGRCSPACSHRGTAWRRVWISAAHPLSYPP